MKRSAQQHRFSWGRFFASAASWTLAAVASAWIALCVSVGPLYRANSSIVHYDVVNAVLFAATWAVCMGIIWCLVRFSEPHSGVLHPWTRWWKRFKNRTAPRVSAFVAHHKKLSKLCAAMSRGWSATRRHIVFLTDRWWKIALILLTCWGLQFIFVPTVFAADLMSQCAEMIRWLSALSGVHVSYADSFNVVDVYPIAHYMWPDTPTYLTNQHNVVLTLFYGGVLYWSDSWTGTIDLGLVFLSATQMLFAIFVVSVTVDRFFNLAHPTRVYARSVLCTSPAQLITVGSRWRTVVMFFFILNPQALFSATALTKSPLFAYAFLWWFGQWYEVFNRRDRTHIPRTLVVGIALSTAIMLVSAKYATYIIAVQIVLIFIVDRNRWRSYLVALVLPFLVFQTALTVAVNTGTIISGDSIESRGVQVQQIARVMRYDPLSVSPDVRKKLQPIFNLYAMGSNYFPNDADRVKSSGGDGKIETYKWETVTQEDMDKFTQAWLELGKQHPIIYTDAFLAKVYGYFDVNDQPYVSTTYYLDNSRLSAAPILNDWAPQVRSIESFLAFVWGSVPVIGWITHGNFYVAGAILLGCAVIILRRWMDLLRYIPLILLMGVMIMAPANNFERHMLPLCFVGWLMLMHFAHLARRAYAQHRIAKVM